METVPSIATVEPVENKSAEPAFMDVPDVVVVLGRSKEYLYTGLREGRFPGVKFGRSWGIPRAFIRGFVADVVELGLTTSFEDYAAKWIAQTQEGVAAATEVAA
jgi:hypothetical protein